MRAGRVLAVTLPALVAGSDQLLKWMSGALPDDGVRLLPGVTLARFVNPHLAGSVPVPEAVVIALAAAALGVAAYGLLRSARGNHDHRLAGWAFVIGGGVSNLADRFFRGGVLDIVRVGPVSYVNLADAAVVIGIALLLLAPKRSTGSRLPLPSPEPRP